MKLVLLLLQLLLISKNETGTANTVVINPKATNSGGFVLFCFFEGGGSWSPQTTLGIQ